MHIQVSTVSALWQNFLMGGGESGIPIRLQITLAQCAVQALSMLRREASIKGGLEQRKAEVTVATVCYTPRVHLRNGDQNAERLSRDKCCPV
jgi:hypothetical protein